MPIKTIRIKRLVPTALVLSLMTSLPLFSAHAEDRVMTMQNVGERAAKSGVPFVAPALEKYLQGPVAALWRRSELSLRDRSIVTLAAVIAHNETTELPLYLDLALENGVKPREISEIITHLAFYTGLPSATAAITVAQDVFARPNIGADQLPAASPNLLPLDEAGEADSAARVGQQFGAVAPGLVQSTTDPLFRDLWLLPDLAP